MLSTNEAESNLAARSHERLRPARSRSDGIPWGRHDECILRTGVPAARDRTRAAASMSETGLALFVLAAFVVPVPLLAWLDRRRG